ncbi:MAG: DNA polymerase III subunit delta, partial [Candidatus Omnitrophica bacterium]|nr:DNA polymerase III subunit delta [Candidatus Omnitrophota bacterium]
GEEGLLKDEAIETLKSKFLDSSTKELNYSLFYANDRNFDVKAVFDTLHTMPFLSKKRLVILKQADDLPKPAKESVILYLRAPKESSILIIESPSSVIKKGDFLLQASKLAKLVYFRRLTDASIGTWLTGKAAQARKKISYDAIKMLKEDLPNDLRILSSNLENIILYTGNRPIITRQDVEKVIGVSPSHTAFDLIDSIEKRDAKKALRIFSSLKRDKKRETELLGLLSWNTRMLFRTKELLKIKNAADMRRDIGLNPRSFERISKQASGFKTSQILNLLDGIVKADLDIKTGMPPKLVMEKLIVKMCSQI